MHVTCNQVYPAALKAAGFESARRSAGGVHLVYNPLYEIVHMDVNQSVIRVSLHEITQYFM